MFLAVPADALDGRAARKAFLARPNRVTARTKDLLVGGTALAWEPIMGALDIQQTLRRVVNLKAADLFSARFGVDPDLDFLPEAVAGIAAVIALELQIESGVAQNSHGVLARLRLLRPVQQAEVAPQALQVIIAGGVLGRHRVFMIPGVPLNGQEPCIGLNLGQEHGRFYVCRADGFEQSRRGRIEVMQYHAIIRLSLIAKRIA